MGGWLGRGPGLSSPQLLGQATRPPAAPSATAAPHADGEAQSAIAGESGSRDARAVGAAIVRRDDLDVVSAPPAVRLLILDARVREMHLVIEVRQVVFTCPFANLVRRAIGPSIAVIVVLVALVQPTLIVALEFVVQHDTIDA